MKTNNIMYKNKLYHYIPILGLFIPMFTRIYPKFFNNKKINNREPFLLYAIYQASLSSLIIVFLILYLNNII